MKTKGKQQPKRTVLLGGACLLALVALLALAGCGGSGGSTSSSTATTSGPAASGGTPFGGKANSKLIACLKEHGVELPSAPQAGGGPPGRSGGPPNFAGGAPGGKPNAKMREAFEKCGMNKFPAGQGRPPGPPNANSATFRKSLTEYVACVRKNGYDLPEPNLSGKGPVFSSSKVNQEDPKFKAASAKCANLIHMPGPGGGQG